MNNRTLHSFALPHGASYTPEGAIDFKADPRNKNVEQGEAILQHLLDIKAEIDKIKATIAGLAPNDR